MSNCLFEATLQEVEKECNCTPKYFVDISPGYDACEGKRKKCMNQLMVEMGDKRDVVDGDEVKVNSFPTKKKLYTHYMSKFEVTLSKILSLLG